MKGTDKKTQHGAAILTAMLTVVLVATLASSSLWQQWRGVEVETAERSRTQSSWVLTGALDWARLILREDARKGGADHLGEPWAVPLASARLATFLAADHSDAATSDDTQDAFLSGQITDLQSRLNVTNLIQGGKVHEPSQLAFARLFKQLNLPPSELAVMVDKLLQAQPLGTQNDANSTPSSAITLVPQTLDQLTWVGLSPATIQMLRPYVSILPEPTAVNLNTAPAEVIYACVDTFDLADAHAMVSARNAKHFESLQDAIKVGGSDAATFNEAQHSVSTRFFEVRGQLRIEQTTVQEISVVQRDGMSVKTLQRQRGVVPALPPLQ